MIYLQILLMFILALMLWILSGVLRDKKILKFYYPPGFARINTPRLGSNEEERTLNLSNGNKYMVPEHSKGHFVLLHDWEVIVIDKEKKKEKYILPEGMATDFASIPKVLHAFMSPLSNSVYAAVLHDYLYRNPEAINARKTSKKQADCVFFWGMRACGVGPITATLMYTAVFLAGGSSYKRTE